MTLHNSIRIDEEGEHPVWQIMNRAEVDMNAAFGVAYAAFQAARQRGDIDGADTAGHICECLCASIMGLTGGDEYPVFDRDAETAAPVPARTLTCYDGGRSPREPVTLECLR